MSYWLSSLVNEPRADRLPRPRPDATTIRWTIDLRRVRRGRAISAVAGGPSASSTRRSPVDAGRSWRRSTRMGSIASSCHRSASPGSQRAAGPSPGESSGSGFSESSSATSRPTENRSAVAIGASTPGRCSRIDAVTLSARGVSSHEARSACTPARSLAAPVFSGGNKSRHNPGRAPADLFPSSAGAFYNVSVVAGTGGTTSWADAVHGSGYGASHPLQTERLPRPARRPPPRSQPAGRRRYLRRRPRLRRDSRIAGK